MIFNRVVFKNQNFNFECKNENIKPVIDKKIEDRIQSNNLLELEVAVETDTEFFKAAGSTLQKAQAYAIALFVMVNSIYEKELNITLYIPWLTLQVLSSSPMKFFTGFRPNKSIF